MNYKILRVCSSDEELTNNFYETDNLNAANYLHQLKRLREENYLVPGSWSECMENLGNESTDLLLNFEPMQKQWGLENNFTLNFQSDNWKYELLCQHVRVYRPDVVFFYAGVFSWFSSRDRSQLKDDFPFIKLIIGFWGDALTGQASYAKSFANTDLVFTSSSAYKEKFDRAGIPAHVVGNCFDHLIARKISTAVDIRPNYEFVFIGTTGYGADLHRQRYTRIADLMEKTSLELWTREENPKKFTTNNKYDPTSIIKWPIKYSAMAVLELLSDHKLQNLRESPIVNWTVAKYIDAILMKRKGEPLRGQFFNDKKKISELYPRRCHEPILLGTDYLDLLNRSKLVLNIHRDEYEDCGNIRVYEATGMGSCLVTDRGDGLNEFFEVDKEIVTFDTSEEAIEKVSYLLENEEERNQIALAGQRRTLSEHTVANRCEKIHEFIVRLI